MPTYAPGLRPTDTGQYTARQHPSPARPFTRGRPRPRPLKHPCRQGERQPLRREAVSQTDKSSGASIGRWDNRSHGAVDPTADWDIVATEAEFGERPPTVPAVGSISSLCSTASRRSRSDGRIRGDRRHRLLRRRKSVTAHQGRCGTGIAVGADGSFSTTVIMSSRGSEARTECLDEPPARYPHRTAGVCLTAAPGPVWWGGPRTLVHVGDVGSLWV